MPGTEQGFPVFFATDSALQWTSLSLKSFSYIHGALGWDKGFLLLLFNRGLGH